ncbi:MAG: SDR family NAD(P)-dependent oxidoreductase [Clostridiales bacterium]|nr:SDR family NAD(P)-dependent oxidoreductase [Clostridiales bacterium]
MKKERRELEGRAAIVTGAGRGIGRAVALKLAEAGASVAVADIELASARQTAAILGRKKAPSLAVAVDVSEEASVAALARAVVDAFGRVDILVNNAGVMFRTRISRIPIGEWENTLRINLTGPFLCIKAVLPWMKKSLYGRIVNVSSSAGRSVSTLGGAHYTASKAGLLGLTRAAAKEVAGYGITVNAVCPGLIDTKMARATTTSDELRGFIRSFPVKRLGRPEEIGDLVVFLCSEKAAYITGASIDINGGDLMI